MKIIKHFAFKNKIICSCILMIFLLNIFANFGLIISNTLAAVTLPSKVVILRKSADGIQTHATNGKYIAVEMYMQGDVPYYAYDIKFTYDSNKIIPADRGTKAAATNLNRVVSQESNFSTNFATNTSYLNTTENSIRLIPNGSPPENPNDYGGELLVYILYFKLVDQSLTEDDLTTDMFSLATVSSLPTGLKIVYDDNGSKSTTDASLFGLENFAEPPKVVSSISIKNNPSDMQYIHGETISLLGGSLTVNYEGGVPSDTVSMTSNGVTFTPNKAVYDNGNTMSTTISYGGKTAILSGIIVTNPAKNIVITPPTKRDYSLNEAFDPTGGKIQVILTNGQTLPDIAITQDMLSGFNTATGGEKNVTISYSKDGKSGNATFKIIVANPAKSISITKVPTKKDYYVNDALNVTGGQITVTYADNTTSTPINMTNDMVKNFDSTTPITGKLMNIEYLGKTTSNSEYKINVHNKIKSIIVDPNKMPKTTYNLGEDLNLTGGEIIATYADNTTKSISLTNSAVTVTGYNKTTAGSQTLNVSFTETGFVPSDVFTVTTTYGVVVNPATVTNVTIATKPKDIYLIGETLKAADLTNGRLTVNYSYGNPTTANITTEMITSFDTNTIGQKNITVYYQKNPDITTTYEIQVENALKEIVLALPNKTNYAVGESFDNTGLGVTAKYLDSTDKLDATIDLSKCIISGFDSISAGQKTITVTYKEETLLSRTLIEKSATFKVNVIEPEIDSIEITTLPKIEYIVNETLTVEGGEFKINYTAGASRENVPMNSGIINGFDTTTVGTKTVTLTYEGKTDTYDIQVGNALSPNLEIIDPTNTVVQIGTDINLDGLVVTAKYLDENDKQSKILNVTDYELSEFDKNTAGTQTITVSYTEIDDLGNNVTATGTFDVTVMEPEIDSIEITALPKTQYIVNETLDIEGGEFKINYTLGDSRENVSMSLGTISGFDTTAVGTVTVTLTYEGKIDTYDIEVGNALNSNLEITGLTNVELKKGQTLDLNSLVITAKYLDENNKTSKILNLEDCEISQFDTNLVGEQTVTISYTEKDDFGNDVTATGTFNIIVKPLTVKDIEIEDLNDIIKEYSKGDAFKEGGNIIVKYEDGTEELIPITEDMIDIDTSKEGEQTVTITYIDREGNEHKEQYTIIVEPKTEPEDKPIVEQKKLVGVLLEKTPTKLKYNHGETIDLSGGTIKLSYSDLSTEILNLPNLKVQLLTRTADSLNKTVKLSYEGFEVQYEIEVEKIIVDIKITKEPKINFKQNGEFDITGGEITITYSDGTKKVIPMTKDMLKTSVDLSTPGKKKIVLQYEENGIIKEFSYEINVEESIKNIILKKFISKITTTNSQTKETKTVNYSEKDNIVKFDINKKNLNKINMVVEYTLKVKNNGNTSETIGQIMDNVPDKLTFTSTQNTDWIMVNNSVTTKKYEDTILKPGEEKEIKLLLTWKESNGLGTIKNMASLTSHKDATAGASEATLILSLETGETTYIAVYSFITLLIGLGVFGIKKFVI